MDQSNRTSNDYLFALQLQQELIDLSESADFDHVDLTTSNPGSGSFIVDLTAGHTGADGGKRNAGNGLGQPPKRSRHQMEATINLVDGPWKTEASTSRGDRPWKTTRATTSPVSCSSEAKSSLVDLTWETIDPNPDIHVLFSAFNRQYFWCALEKVVVEWSKRMTVCAGLCRFQNGFCSIRLSEPLLKLRPRKDLVETLLHEMIHAYLFLTNNREHRDRDGHGSEFCKHMFRINKNAGTNISIYHDFHDEVKLYRQHWWKCQGLCQNNPPFYGTVKRSINRPPGPSDYWWGNHLAICGGQFIKTKEPEGYGLKKKKVIPIVPTKTVKPENKITNFIKVLDSPSKSFPEEKTEVKSSNDVEQEVQQNTKVIDDDEKMTLCPVCNESVLEYWLNDHLQNCSRLKEMFGDENDDKCNCPACNDLVVRSLMNEHLDSCKMLNNVFDDTEPVQNSANVSDNYNYVNCPNCDNLVKDNNINDHLDICLSDEEPIPNVENKIKCPSCKNTFKSIIELDSHIDSCLLDD